MRAKWSLRILNAGDGALCANPWMSVLLSILINTEYHTIVAFNAGCTILNF